MSTGDKRQRKSISFCRQVDSAVLKTQQSAKKDSQAIINAIRTLLDEQYTLAWPHLLALNSGISRNIVPHHRLLATAFLKNINSIYAAMQINADGYPGYARPTIRSCYEFVILAKYVSCSGDLALYKKWYDGEKISLSNDVLNKVKSPSTEVIRSWWKELSSQTHATIYGQQQYFDYKEIKDQININFDHLLLILHLNYLLLKKYLITSSSRYYTDRYSPSTEHLIAEERLKRIFGNLSKYNGNETKLLLRTYQRTWVCKSVPDTEVQAPPHEAFILWQEDS
jgi:hypothetical protein